MKRIILALSILPILSLPALADECRGVVIKDIPGNDYDGKAGSIVEQLHSYEGKPDGTPLTYAVHGGSVYPADHIKILNCSIRKIATDPYYDLVLNNTSENADDIIMQKAQEKLSNMGIDNADASNAAYAYAKSPQSACGKMAARAIAGDTSASEFIMSAGVCQPQ